MRVEAQYNWKGILIGYNRDGSSVPIDPANRDYQEIQTKIAEGQCEIIEPILGQVNRGYDRHGKHSGFHTRFGFVPAQQENVLFRLIEKQLKDGRCSIEEDSKKETQIVKPKISSLIFCVLFEEPWPHVAADFCGQLTYASNDRSAKRSFNFVLRNLPEEKKISKVDIFLAHHKASAFEPTNALQWQFGAIEIEVPVLALRSLFFGEAPLMQDWINPFLMDLVEQHYARTGRRKSEGPDISWLISHASMYLSHFVVEFSNRVLEAFKNEYGNIPVPYFPEGWTGNNIVVLSRTESGATQFYTFVPSSKQNFNLKGAWSPSSLTRFEAESESPWYHQRSALRRVSEMLSLGFHAESLAILNAFLEVTVLQCLRGVSGNYPGLEKLGHTRSLKLLIKIADECSNQWLSDGTFLEMLQNATSIYAKRNSYVHALSLLDSMGRLSLRDRRQLESLFKGFIDVFHQRQFLWRLDHIAEDTGEIRKLVIRELDRDATEKQVHAFVLHLKNWILRLMLQLLRYKK